MKIVFLSKALPAEGSTIQQIYLADELIKKGHSVTVLAGPNRFDSNELSGRFLEIGAEVKYLPFPTKPFGSVSKIVLLFWYMLSLPMALFLLFKFKPDVIHCHWPVTSYVAAVYRFLTGKKFVTTYHISGIPKHPLHRNADKVVAISSELKIDAVQRFGYDSKDVITIFNGVPLPQKKRNFIANKIVKILFVGSVIHRKGLDILIDAIALCGSSKFQLLVVGAETDSSYSEAVKELAQKRNVDVKFFGWSNPSDFYNKVDLFCLPSRAEGFPLVAVEAMMNKLPVIRSNTYGATDQINHEVDGFLFESESSYQLADILRKLVDNKPLRDKVGLNGYLKAKKEFSSSKNSEDTIDLYHSIV